MADQGHQEEMSQLPVRRRRATPSSLPKWVRIVLEMKRIMEEEDIEDETDSATT